MFIGKKEIKEINGNEVIFNDNSTEYFSDKQLLLVTENEITESELQNNAANNIVLDILKVLEEHNMKQGDLQFILQKLISSYNSTFDEVVAKLFNREDVTEIRISDIKNNKEKF